MFKLWQIAKWPFIPNIISDKFLLICKCQCVNASLSLPVVRMVQYWNRKPYYRVSGTKTLMEAKHRKQLTIYKICGCLYACSRSIKRCRIVRYDTRQEAELAIKHLNGTIPAGSTEPATVKFANCPASLTSKLGGALPPCIPPSLAPFISQQSRRLLQSVGGLTGNGGGGPQGGKYRYRIQFNSLIVRHVFFVYVDVFFC